MLALETGWTDTMLAEMSPRTRARYHWALYARAVAGPEGLPDTEIPKHAPLETRLAILSQKVAVDKHRQILFPEDDDGDA